MIEQNVDFFTLSQIKLFATHIKFRKSNRQHLKNKQTVKLAWLTLSASFEIAQIVIVIGGTWIECHQMCQNGK